LRNNNKGVKVQFDTNPIKQKSIKGNNMVSKELPFTKDEIQEIIKKYPTPFHIYDEKAILKMLGE
jgi:Diaminopimelate decarboxylase